MSPSDLLSALYWSRPASLDDLADRAEYVVFVDGADVDIEDAALGALHMYYQGRAPGYGDDWISDVRGLDVALSRVIAAEAAAGVVVTS